MVSKTAKVAIVVTTVATAGGVAYILTRPAKAVSPPPSGQVPTTLNLAAQATTIPINTEDTFTATLLDQNNKAIADYPVTLIENTTQTAGTANTDSTGTATFDITLTTTGTYEFYAEVS